MMALSEEQASRIFERLRDDEIRDLSLEMSNLGKVDASLVEKVMLELSRRWAAAVGLLVPWIQPNGCWQKSLGKIAVPTSWTIFVARAGRNMWDKLSNVNEVMLANYLKNEYPQTVAVVLS
jgi:flagellar motor switch protein FliG